MEPYYLDIKAILRGDDEKIILKHYITDYFDENEVEYNSVNLKG